VSSLYLAANGSLALLYCDDGSIYCWDVFEQKIVASFTGHRSGHFVIRPCFGGHDEAFVAAGSEDSKVYIWHRSGGTKPIAVLFGHTGTVNAVAWNPMDPQMLVSVSDDHTVVIWGKDEDDDDDDDGASSLLTALPPPPSPAAVVSSSGNPSDDSSGPPPA